jgi:DNA-binding GntR family transcriptional regulator
VRVSEQSGSLDRLPRPASLSEQAYLALREGIATRRIEPGERLTERSLAMRFGVSPTPVREALRRLEQEGLIQRSGPKTITVVEHSGEVLAELAYTEVVLRAALARFAAAKATQDDISGLRRIAAWLVASADGDPGMILEIAGRFDDEIVRIAGNSAVASLYRSAALFGRARREQSVRVMQTSRRDLGDRHIQAHLALIDALEAHDVDRAERVVREHLLSVRELLMSDLEAQP